MGLSIDEALVGPDVIVDLGVDASELVERPYPPRSLHHTCTSSAR